MINKIATALLLLSTSLLFGQKFDDIDKIVPDDRVKWNDYGCAVSVFGDYAIVGMKGDNNDSIGTAHIGLVGSAYIYKRDSTGRWIELQKLHAWDGRTGDSFGYDVGIYDNYVIIGAPNNDYDVNNTNTSRLNNAGAAYIFKKDTSGVFKKYHKIVPSPRKLYGSFGNAVAIHKNYLIIGAYNYESGGGGNQGKGAAFIYNEGHSKWVQQSKIQASDKDFDDEFGISVDIFDDYAVVGAHYEDSDTNGLNYILSSGSAYVFKRDGNNWVEDQKLVASDRKGGSEFGNSVAIHNKRIVIGAVWDSYGLTTNSPIKQNAGAAYYFDLDTNNNFAERQKLISSDRDSYDYFGSEVDISENYIGITATGDDENDKGLDSLAESGSAYMYTKDTSNNWVIHKKIVAYDRDQSMKFGNDISISNEQILIGAEKGTKTSEGKDSTNDAGSIYWAFSSYKKTDSLIACRAYLWRDSVLYTKNNTTAMDTSWLDNGRDTIFQLKLNIPTIDTTLYQFNHVKLETNEPSLIATFQWLDCDNNYDQLIGDTSYFLIAPRNGSFALEITKKGCKDTSECISILSVGIEDILPHEQLKISPNPTKGQFIVDASSMQKDVTITLSSIDGKIIETVNTLSSKQKNFSISGPSGIYLITVGTTNYHKIYKVVKY